MKRIKELSKEITRITSEIEENHPELYRFLEENPIGIARKNEPDMGIDVFADYLESLKALLLHHLESKKK